MIYGKLSKFRKSPPIMRFVKCDVISHLYSYLELFIDIYIKELLTLSFGTKMFLGF